MGTNVNDAVSDIAARTNWKGLNSEYSGRKELSPMMPLVIARIDTVGRLQSETGAPRGERNYKHVTDREQDLVGSPPVLPVQHRACRL